MTVHRYCDVTGQLEMLDDRDATTALEDFDRLRIWVPTGHWARRSSVQRMETHDKIMQHAKTTVPSHSNRANPSGSMGQRRRVNVTRYADTWRDLGVSTHRAAKTVAAKRTEGQRYLDPCVLHFAAQHPAFREFVRLVPPGDWRPTAAVLEATRQFCTAAKCLDVPENKEPGNGSKSAAKAAERHHASSDVGFGRTESMRNVWSDFIRVCDLSAVSIYQPTKKAKRKGRCVDLAIQETVRITNAGDGDDGGEAAFPLALIEVNNEAGTDGDALTQALTFYSQYATFVERWYMYDTHRQCPRFLCGMAGPKLVIAGVLVTNKIHVQELVRVSLDNATGMHDTQHLQHVARVLRALCIAAPLVKEPVRVDMSPAAELEARRRVVFSHVHIAGQRFLFTEHIARDVYRGRFGGTPAVLKFGRYDNLEAHRALQDLDAGYTSRLLASEVIVPGVRAIVMDDLRYTGFVPAHDVEWTTQADVESVCAGIHTIAQALHEAGFVMGDLREPNVMVRRPRDGEGDGWQVRLIDFEFTRRVGQQRPEFSYNRELEWPPELVSALDGGDPLPAMKPAHDAFMLEKMQERMGVS